MTELESMKLPLHPVDQALQYVRDLHKNLLALVGQRFLDLLEHPSE